MKLIESKILSKNKKFILENLKQAKQYVAQGKLSLEDLETLIKLDPTSNRKYVGWMSKIWIQDKPNLDDLRNTIEEFNTLLNKGKTKTKDINQFKSFNDLKNEVTHINDSGDAISVKELEKDYETITDTPDLLIMCPHTHEASRLLGLTHFAFRTCSDDSSKKDSAWCTTYKAPDHFNDYYYSNNVTFYYIKVKGQGLQSKIKQAFPHNYLNLYVVALAVLPDGRIDGYDGLDKQINKSDIDRFCKILKIN